MKIYILMPTYNDSSTIVYSLDSILSQNYKNYEIIIPHTSQDFNRYYKFSHSFLIVLMTRFFRGILIPLSEFLCLFICILKILIKWKRKGGLLMSELSKKKFVPEEDVKIYKPSSKIRSFGEYLAVSNEETKLSGEEE